MSTMGVKIGTKAFGQTQTKPESTGTGTNNLSAGDLQKLAGGENVGEVLNKIADPNWVDPAKKMRAVGNDKLDKDAFFKLMLAQMKNQDPTNPLKPHEMSAQLANFSALEQMTNVNKNLEELKAIQKPAEQFQTLALIGKTVEGDSAQITRLKGDREHDIKFNLPQASTATTISVHNSEGEVIRKVELKNLKAGENKFTWNGLNEQGQAARPDEYRVVIDAKGNDGKSKVAVQTRFQGQITGVNYTAEGPVLLIGTQTVRLKDLRKIIDPSLKKNDQNAADSTPKNFGNMGAPVQNEGSTQEAQLPAAEEEMPKPDMMSGVALSREMMTRLQKETKPDVPPTPQGLTMKPGTEPQAGQGG